VGKLDMSVFKTPVKLAPLPEKLVALKAPLEALKDKLELVDEDVIVPDVCVVKTTLWVPEAALNVEPMFDKFDPSPLKALAVIVPEKFPVPALVMFPLLSITVVPDT